MDDSKRAIWIRLLWVTECLFMMVTLANGYGSSLSPWLPCHGDGCCETRTHGDVIIIAEVVEDDPCEVSSTQFPPSNPTTDQMFTTEVIPASTSEPSVTEQTPLTATVTKSITKEPSSPTTTTTEPSSSTTTSSTTSEPSPSTTTTSSTPTAATTTTEASVTEDYSSVTPIVSEFTRIMSESPYTNQPNFTTGVFSSTTTACMRPEPVTGTIIIITEVVEDQSCGGSSTMAPFSTRVF